MRYVDVEVVAPVQLDLRRLVPGLASNEDGSSAVLTLDELVRLLQDLPASVRLLVTTGEWVP